MREPIISRMEEPFYLEIFEDHIKIGLGPASAEALYYSYIKDIWIVRAKDREDVIVQSADIVGWLAQLINVILKDAKVIPYQPKYQSPPNFYKPGDVLQIIMTDNRVIEKSLVGAYPYALKLMLEAIHYKLRQHPVRYY